MPTNDWQCPKCGEARWDLYQPALLQIPPPCECGEVMERLWSISGRSGGQVWPYVTANITGSPIEVKSPGHLRELEKRHGVRLRDDSAFVEKRVEATGKGPKWVEGSGRGMPGCW